MQTIFFIIFWEFLMFYQIFLSQKVKRCANITYKRGRYEFPHKLSNDLTLRILQNSIIRKVSKLLSAHSSYQNLNFVNTSKKLLKNRELPIVPYFTWKLELVSNVLWMKFWPTLVNTDFNETFFINLVLVLINVVEVAMLIMTHILKYVFQIK